MFQREIPMTPVVRQSATGSSLVAYWNEVRLRADQAKSKDIDLASVVAQQGARKDSNTFSEQQHDKSECQGYVEPVGESCKDIARSIIRSHQVLKAGAVWRTSRQIQKRFRRTVGVRGKQRPVSCVLLPKSIPQLPVVRFANTGLPELRR